MNIKGIAEAVATISSLQPDIAVVLTAYNVLHGIWMQLNPGKTEADYLEYLRSAAQANVDATAAYLRAQGYVETPAGSGNWSKPTPTP